MISVIVPIYNVGAYLEQCLESICSQTYRDLEIILVDDGSTDRCPEICEAYRRRDGRIQVIRQPNAGLVSARQAGLRAASGEFIGYVDGDDWIEPEMYERLHQKMAEYPVDAVMCGRYEDTGAARRPVFHGFAEGLYDRSRLRETVYPRMVTGEDFFEWGIFPNVWDKLFRREKLLSFQLQVDPRITVGEDAACVYPYLLHAEGIYVLRECLYHYRQTETSMLKRRESAAAERERFQVLYRTVRRQLAEGGVAVDFEEQWKKYMLFLMVPRADGVYRGFGELEYLFPFPGVRRGAGIVLYGAGTYGQRLYSYLRNSGFCRVVLWVDRNYAQFQAMGLPVKAPAELAALAEYDAVVIANMMAHSRRALYRELILKYPKEKIHLMDEELIFSREAALAFGLAE